MKIFDADFTWKGSLSKRSKTDFIVLHHRAGDGDVSSIHQGHLKNGWSGIGYHFYVRKDGSVFRGRPLGTIGAHCTNYNGCSVGVCFEGDFEKESMTAAQLKAGQSVVDNLKNLYPKAEVKRHGELQATACPGRNFPFDEICKGVCEMTLEDAIEIIQAKAGLEDETIEFLLCYKYGEELITKLADAVR